MKQLLFLGAGVFILAALGACTRSSSSKDQTRTVDSLARVVEWLKPGLGEFMVQLEFHESRLARSIGEKDFERAGFEVDEMTEVAEKVNQLQITNDKLKEPFSVFYRKYLIEPLDSLKKAAIRKDDASLHRHLGILLNNCNSCHKENNMAFMKINY